ncbi:hypothetical protein GCM10027598_62130 [Amycolatopsis oliviviridis]|uniref:Uncharacterized protein n=1 Tax=Amycolatopsis oliviviridis TaxID=1471590 RepID=A0ABQ3MDF2_9PSEU|nr:hypothetical protein [Amycolatopsis oliviviridis]GHH32782.1 hypothetical protein GCM10017790_70420 [Amycolatopsis oliviviridis]
MKMQRDLSDWDIIPLLDEHAKSYDFPVLNNEDIDLAGVRLTAFRGEDEWLVVFEEIEVFRRQRFANGVFAYGNKIAKSGSQGSDDLILGEPLGSPPLWDDTGNFLLDPEDFRIRACHSGNEYHFTPSPREYERAGIVPDNHEHDAAKILRFLVNEIPAELYATDDRLLRTCGKTEPLARFTQLTGWRHPDVIDDELPSDSPCLQSLAAALIADDPAIYECAPEQWNTHWSAWPPV